MEGTTEERKSITSFALTLALVMGGDAAAGGSNDRVGGTDRDLIYIY